MPTYRWPHTSAARRLTNKWCLITLLILALMFTGSCRKNTAPSDPVSVFAQLPDLPIASHGEKLRDKYTADEMHFIEVQFSDHGWHVQGGSASHEELEIEKRINSNKERINALGHHPKLVIEADPNIAVNEVKFIMACSMRTGVDDFLFAVKASADKPNALINGLWIKSSCGCGQSEKDIRTVQIQARENNILAIMPTAKCAKGSAPIINSADKVVSLEELKKHLSETLRAACCYGQEAQPALNLHSQTSYQTLISIIDLLNELEFHSLSISIDDERNQGDLNSNHYPPILLPASQAPEYTSKPN